MKHTYEPMLIASILIKWFVMIPPYFKVRCLLAPITYKQHLINIVMLSHHLSSSGLEVPSESAVFKLSARIFDPLGLVSHLVIRLKTLFTSLCTDSVNWDDPIVKGMQ